jgi:hypothetical protein
MTSSAPVLNSLPDWLTSGPWPVILAIAVLIFIVGFWINNRLNRVQRKLHELGKGYYQREEQIQNDYKSGLISEKEYRKRHDRLVQEMREESRKMTD